MNRFLKINSPWLGLAGFAVIIILLAFVFRPKSPQYLISADQTLKLIHDQSLQIGEQNLAGKQIIDIRSPEMFGKGHPEGAINIPVRQLLDDTSVELYQQLLKNGKVAVLVGTDELQAISPWLLLQQMGYSNILRFRGGYLADSGLTATSLSATESSVVEPAAFSKKLQEIPAPALAVQKKKAETVIPVRKAASSGGGC